MKSQSKHFLFLFLAVVAISYFTWAIFNSGKRLEKTADWVGHTHQVITGISNVSTSLSEIQADFRGWLAIDKQTFGADVDQRTTLLRKQIDNVKTLTKDNTVQQRNILKIEKLSEELINWQNAFMKSHQSAGITTVSPGIHGKLIMDSIKEGLAVMNSTEQTLLQQRSKENKRISDSRLAMTFVGGLSYLIFAIVTILQIRRNAARRKINKLSLLQSETKYRRLIEDAGVVMFTTDINGKFTYINHRIKSVLGFEESEVLGKSFSMLVEKSYLPKVNEHYLDQYMTRKEEACIEFPALTKSGEQKWIEQDSVLIFENDNIIGFQCVVKDIDLRKKAEVALLDIEKQRKEYEYRLQSILDNTPLMIFIKDLEGKYLLVNKRFKEFYGDENSLIGKTDYDFDIPQNADKYKKADQEVIKTLQPIELEETVEKDGIKQNLMVVKFPLLDQSGKVFGISGIATDVTERVQYHMHLLDTRKKAETAERLQGEFLANMSHEIRTPMNGIVGMTNLLLQTNLDAEQERFLHIVRQSSDNLLFLINDILDLSKIKAGKMTIESIEFNIGNVIETVIAPFRIKMKEKGVKLITQFDPDIPEMLVGDPYRLSQILSNLFSNAIKFTSRGHIKFTVNMVPEGSDYLLDFAVEDTGIGIADNKINYIFESFAQASMDTTRKFGGTGLGLSITKQLIQLQDGTMEVTSKVDEGTKFRFTIPYKQVHAHVIQQENEKQLIDKGALKGKKVLIVEDNEINQMVIAFTLKQAGILTTIVNNGKEAVELLQSGDDTNLNFDLIIMDLQMPEMDGFQASTYIRNILLMQTPIIAMTASVLRDERIRCFEAGMNDYMSKPFKPAELFVTISKFLNDKNKMTLPENLHRKPALSITPYDFKDLYKMMPRSQAGEVLGLFVENAPILLNKLQTAILLESWQEVTAHAQILKSSIELLQLHEMMPDIIDIERMSRLNVQLDVLPTMVNRLIEYYNTIKPMLEEEKNQMAIA